MLWTHAFNGRTLAGAATASFVLLCIACAGGRSTFGTDVKPARVGEEFTLKDSKWFVVSAANLGKTVKPRGGIGRDATTAGKFILVRFKVTNTTGKEERIFDTPVLIDGKGREYRQYDQQSIYLPEAGKNITAEALPAGLTKEFTSLYELPADAKNLKFQARGLAAFSSDKRNVELGF